MDIDQLRGWATFVDKAVVASFVVTVVAVAALGTTTWLSSRIAGAVREQEQAASDRYRGELMQHGARLEQEALAARARVQELEQAVAAANARAGQAAQASVKASETARSAEIDAEEVRRRVEELGRAVMAARARTPEVDQPTAVQSEAKVAPTVAAEASGAPPAPSPVAERLRRYAGARAALFVLDEARDGAAIALTISGFLGDAGWDSSTWTWSDRKSVG